MAKPKPPTKREFLNTFVDPYIKEVSTSVQKQEAPVPGVPDFNRSFEISMKGDKDKIPKIGINDIDEAIQFYFNNRLKLTVFQNNVKVPVPVLYGSPERWKAVQADGYYRDANGKIQTPLIMYKMETMEQNRELGNKLDGNSANNVIMLKKGFSRRNVYDNFYLLNNQKPQQEYMLVIVPDYVTITYSCVIFTEYVEQMNKLMEALNFASNSYWGDPSRFQFRARIDSFNSQLTLEEGQDRAVKSNFNMVLNGYLVPDSINAELAKIANKFHNFTNVVFNLETVRTTL